MSHDLSFEYRKVSYLVGEQVIYTQKIPLHKTRYQVIKIILRETKSTRPYSAVRLRNAQGDVYDVMCPVSSLKLLRLYKSL